MRPVRSEAPQRKPRRLGSTREVDQGRTVRLETRAGESTAVASLRGSKPRRRRETDKSATGV